MCAYQVDCARAHVRATTVTVVMDVDGMDDGLLSANVQYRRCGSLSPMLRFTLPPMGPCGQCGTDPRIFVCTGLGLGQ